MLWTLLRCLQLSTRNSSSGAGGDDDTSSSSSGSSSTIRVLQNGNRSQPSVVQAYNEYIHNESCGP